MHRFGCLVLIGALAVAVCVVAAGPAVAAKGGNDLRVACRDDNGLFVTNALPPSSLQGICSART